MRSIGGANLVIRSSMRFDLLELDRADFRAGAARHTDDDGAVVFRLAAGTASGYS
jgi:hypothetical protein